MFDRLEKVKFDLVRCGDGDNEEEPVKPPPTNPNP